MEQQFLAVAQNGLMARMASGEIDTAQKRQNLLDAFAEELLVKYPECANIRVLLVAGT